MKLETLAMKLLLHTFSADFNARGGLYISSYELAERL